jgi:selenocysteine-specific elongation factor
VEEARAGERAAVNLQGIETSSIERGDVLAHPKTLAPTSLLDVYLQYLPIAPRPLKHRTPHRFHLGTSSTTASIFLLDRDELSPGEEGFAQLRLERPVVSFPQDRFVIRGSGAIQTLGGGVVLDTHPLKHRRYSPAVTNDLTLLRDGSSEEATHQYIRRSGAAGITLGELLARVAMPPNRIQIVLRKMIEKGDILLVDPEKMKVIEKSQYQRLKEMALVQLREFHQRFPMRTGLAKEELRTKLPAELDMKLFQILINDLIQSKEMVLEKDKLRLREHHISSADEKGLVRRVEEAVLKGRLQPPSPKELMEEWSEEEERVLGVFEHLAHEGVLIKVKSGMFFHRIPFENLKGELISFLKSHKEITTSQFKELTGASRKYVIPLIEYFDQTKLTLRLGEKRVLRS